MPHHVSVNHPHMSATNRAAQFSPFASLTGYGDAIFETARLTEPRTELGEWETEELNLAFRRLRERISSKPSVKVKYFLPDDRKSGGVYLVYEGRAVKIDEFGRILFLEGGASIPLDDICILEFTE